VADKTQEMLSFIWTRILGKNTCGRYLLEIIKLFKPLGIAYFRKSISPQYRVDDGSGVRVKCLRERIRSVSNAQRELGQRYGGEQYISSGWVAVSAA
jgi:hypothetical protein